MTAHRMTPTREHAEGMLTALTRGHTCGTACTATVQIGTTTRRLTCPYARLDLDSETDRRIIASLYADAARAAMPARG